MARSSVKDPLDKFRFILSFEGLSRAGFVQCGTPSYNITPREYAEGGAHLHPRSIVDKMSYVPITLTRGVTIDTTFSKWASQVFDLYTDNETYSEGGGEFSITNAVNALNAGVLSNGRVVGNPGHKVPSNIGIPFSYRKNIVIEHVDRTGQSNIFYTLYNCYPISYKPASDFDANADDGMSIESITLAYEGFSVTYTGASGTLGNILSQT